MADAHLNGSRGVTARQLDDALRGHCFARPQRHGKWLIAPTDGPAVLSSGVQASIRAGRPGA